MLNAHQQPLAENEYRVTSHSGEEGIATLRLPAVDLHWLNHSRESWSFTELLNLARRGALPEWVGQVKPLAERIEAVFQREREAGKDPYFKTGISGDEVFYADLRR